MIQTQSKHVVNKTTKVGQDFRSALIERGEAIGRDVRRNVVRQQCVYQDRPDN